MSELIVKNGIKDETALLAMANEQSLEGKKDLVNYVLCHSSKGLNELIQQTWKMKNASKILERKKRCRMDIVREAAAGQCAQGCEGMWLKCAEEVLYNNKVHPILYAAARARTAHLGKGQVQKSYDSRQNKLWQNIST